MKYLKIHVIQPVGGQMVYPANYESEIGNFAKDHLYYNDEVGECYLLLAIEDADYKPSMIKTNVEAITETEAKALSEANETRTETIKDEAKVRRIEILSRLGMTLTKEDQDSLDPTKPDAVFGTSEILADRIVDLKAKEAIKVAK